MRGDRDIGWQHGKMIGGCRHRLQCNYCHRSLTGGITRFKQHLACKKGEIKGCDAVPKEVKELIRKHLRTEKKRKRTRARQQKEGTEASTLLSSEESEDGYSWSEESDREGVAATLEDPHAQSEAKITNQAVINDDQQLIADAREFLDVFSSNSHKGDQDFSTPGTTDPGWAHGDMINGGRQKTKCKYCNKVILGGGISRLKQHLAGERGNVTPCEEVPENIKMQIRRHLSLKVVEKSKRHRGSKSRETSIVSSFQSKDQKDDDGQGIMRKSFKQISGRKKRGITSADNEGTSNQSKKELLPMTISPVEQNFGSQENIEQADIAVAKFMYDAGLPLSASNSYYFQKMADAIASAGPGYRMPSYHSLRGNLLDRSVQSTRELCDEVRKSWKVTGCSVMVDRWSVRADCTVLNFFAYCPKGTVFLKSIDLTDVTDSYEVLVILFDTIVQEVGPNNIVNFMTDTAPSYKAAGKAVMGKYGTFFWSACSAHCIDLMLKEIGEMDGINQVLTKAKKITQFIYNDAWLLDLMRKSTGGRDVVQLENTAISSSFVTLQNIVSLKDPLYQMFTSPTWTQSSLSKQMSGLEVEEIIMDLQFWSLCDNTLRVTEPLCTVLYLSVCEERPSMGYIYDAMEKAKRSVVMAFNHESDYIPYLNIINRIWKEELHNPLHAAGYYLNASKLYDPSFMSDKVIQKGLLDCIETLEPDLDSQVKITSHINFYKDAAGDFGRPVALLGRESLAPATWWSLYGADYPDLQRLAVRILSQSCSIIPYDRRRSMFECIHANKRNCLENKRLIDLIFVHYNLRLQERQETSKAKSVSGGHEPLCLEAFDDDLTDWVEGPRRVE